MDEKLFCDSIHYIGELIYSHIQRPSGSAIIPNLLCYRRLEVLLYVCASGASHLRQTCQLQDLGTTTITETLMKAVPRTSRSGNVQWPRDDP